MAKKPIKVFISYSWDSESHEQWVYDLAVRLRKDGFDVILDKYYLQLGQDMTLFMERSISNAKKVIIIMTKKYKKKADSRKNNGVGYEYSLITPDLLNRNDLQTFKYIPVIREEPRKKSTPMALMSRLAVNLSSTTFDEKSYQSLVKGLKDLPEKPIPPINREDDHIQLLLDPITLISSETDNHLKDDESLVKEMDLPLLVRIVESLHPNHEKLKDIYSIFLKWYKKNHHIFKLAYKLNQNSENGLPISLSQSEIIGFTCVIPLTESAYQKYRSGKMSEWEIGDMDNDIQHFPQNYSCRYLLIQSVEFLKQFWQKDGYGTAFMFSFLRHLSYYNLDPINTKLILIADGNKKGIDLLEKYGFHKILYHGDAKDPRPRYMLDFSEPFLGNRAKKTVDQITDYLLKHSSPNNSTN